jgi:uncharacterized protein with GYD domain
MATYIGLMKFTPQGVQSIREMPARVEKNIGNLKKLGIEIKSWHMTMGRYDIVTVFDAPNDEAAAKASLAIASQGNAHTETLRAYSLEDAKKMISSLG